MANGAGTPTPHDGSTSAARWAGTLGVAIPAIAIPVYPIWRMPPTQTSGADIAIWAANHHDRLVATQVLYTIGVGLWIIFGAALWTRLRSQLPTGSALPTAFGLGIIGLVTLILSGFTAFNLLLYRPRSPETSALLYDLAVGLLAMSGVPTAIALAAFAIAVYRYRILRRATTHIATVAAIAHALLITAFIAPDGALSLQGPMTVWAIPLLLFTWIGHTARTIHPVRNIHLAGR